MLTRGDKEFIQKAIREIVKEEITKALTVKVKFERRRHPETGQPLATPETEVRDVYLPAHWVEYLPYMEGSLRGVQETTDHVKNNMNQSSAAVETMSQIMLKFQTAMTNIVALASELKSLPAAKEEIIDV